MSKPKVAIVGYGYVGQAYHKVFPDAVIYDEPKQFYEFTDGMGRARISWSLRNTDEWDKHIAEGRELVNSCDLAIVAVFTPHKEDGSLDISIVEEVIGWIETPLILIKSALHPGTTDYLVKKTGKNIAVSVEFIGEGNYYVPPEYPDPKDPTKHQMLIIGGEPKTAEACAEILWSRMSPTINIHLVSALEAEITKLVENSYGALKVTFINCLLSLTQKSGTSFMNIHQAWQSDPRTDSMHLRATTFNRGWRSKCWDKDVPALAAYAKEVGALDMMELFEMIIHLNKEHLNG